MASRVPQYVFHLPSPFECEWQKMMHVKLRISQVLHYEYIVLSTGID
jgi:hypothetical protein